jgi:hypothetical protein
MEQLELEPQGEKEYVCDCCGATTHTVWGWVHEPGATRCAYLVRWSESSPHLPHVTLGYGSWGAGTTSADRASVYAELQRGKPRFVDHPAPGAPLDEPETLGIPIAAKAVRKDPRAGEVRETLEFILSADPRVRPALAL